MLLTTVPPMLAGVVVLTRFATDHLEATAADKLAATAATLAERVNSWADDTRSGDPGPVRDRGRTARSDHFRSGSRDVGQGCPSLW